MCITYFSFLLLACLVCCGPVCPRWPTEIPPSQAAKAPTPAPRLAQRWHRRLLRRRDFWNGRHLRAELFSPQRSFSQWCAIGAGEPAPGHANAMGRHLGHPQAPRQQGLCPLGTRWEWVRQGVPKQGSVACADHAKCPFPPASRCKLPSDAGSMANRAWRATLRRLSFLTDARDERVR